MPLILKSSFRAKSYSLVIENDDSETNEQKIVAAGIRKTAHSTLKHERYMRALFDEGYSHNVCQYSIASKKHTLYTIQKQRIGLIGKLYFVNSYILLNQKNQYFQVI